MTSRLGQNSVVINGSSSGSATIAPPAAAGTPTLTLPTSSGTLALTSQLNSGTVTSVATGNGLQGGTITTTGTLSIACPSFNTVGSYCFGQIGNSAEVGTASVTAGSNYSAGTSKSQIVSSAIANETSAGVRSNNLSGTWKWMGGTNSGENGYTAIACRVS